MPTYSPTKYIYYIKVFLLWHCSFGYEFIQAQSFHNYNTDNGLAQSFVSSIIQDKEGYIWAATHNGLSRFDGIFFRNYRSNAGLRSNKIYQLLKDQQENLWVITDECVYQYNRSNQTFQTPACLRHQKPARFKEALFDSKNRLWVLRHDSLLCFRVLTEPDLLQKTFAVAINTQQTGIPLSVSVEGDTSVIAGSLGLFSCAFNDQHLTRLPVTIQGAPKQVWHDRLFGGMWIHTSQGTGLWRNGRLQWFPGIKTSMYMRRFNNYTLHKTYLISNNGVYIWDGHTLHCKTDHLPFDILSACIDSRGGLWLGSNAQGLYYYKESLDSFIHAFGIGKIIAAGVYKEKYGNIISLMNPQSRAIQVLESNLAQTSGAEPAVLNMCVDKTGEKWLLLPNKMLKNAAATRHWQIRQLKSSEKPELMRCISGTCVVIVRSKSILFVRTATGQTLELDSASIIWLQHRQMLRINAIKEDNAGQIWFGSDNGILKAWPNWAAGKIETSFYLKNKHLPDCEVLALETGQESANDLWLGTLNGFYHYNPGTNQYRNISTRHISGNEAVYCMQRDLSGVLWLGTNAGLKRYDPRTQNSEIFTTMDGLPAGEFNRNTESMASDGEILMGTIAGGIRFQPEKLYALPKQCNMVISEVLLNDTTSQQSFSGSMAFIECQPKDRITLNYALLEFFAPASHRYKYRLSGVSDQWSSSAATAVTYAGLSSGTYVFEVCGEAGNKEWSAPAQLEIRVLPAPYSRALWWLLASGGLGLFFWLIIKRKNSLFSPHESIQKGVDLPASAIVVVHQPAPAGGETIPLPKTFSEVVLSLIEANFHDSEFNIIHIQEKLKISKAQLHRKMVGETGNTAAYFLKKRRLDEAIKLLQERPDMTIAEIAYSTGFSDPNYFSTTFSANFGQSPKNYRKNEPI